MKKLLIINPNSSDKMTRDIRNTVSYGIDKEFSIYVTRTPNSPEVLESFADYTEAGREVIIFLREMAGRGTFPYDGVLLACMGDPCLYGVKEVCPVPLIGIAEAGISTALLTGYKFSILASSNKAKPMMESMVMTYGLTARLASVETFGVPIEDFMQDEERLCTYIRDASKRAVSHGADVLLLGCAGMTAVQDRLSELSDIPVIDPIKAGVEQLKAILRGGFPVSRNGLYA